MFRLIVFSSDNAGLPEAGIVNQMFDEGLMHFHLRKPKFSSKQLEEYIDCIKPAYRNKIVLHSHHRLVKKKKLKGIHLNRVHRRKKYSARFKFWLLRLRHPTWTVTRSCHKLSALSEQPERYDYVFLSPVFNSISKKNHSGSYNLRAVKTVLKQHDYTVIAQGGVDLQNIKIAHETGFNGVALLGHIWESKNPIEAFRKAIDLIDKINQSS